MRTERSDTCLILSSEQRAPCRFIRAAAFFCAEREAWHLLTLSRPNAPACGSWSPSLSTAARPAIQTSRRAVSTA